MKRTMPTTVRAGDGPGSWPKAFGMAVLAMWPASDRQGDDNLRGTVTTDVDSANLLDRLFLLVSSFCVRAVLSTWVASRVRLLCVTDRKHWLTSANKRFFADGTAFDFVLSKARPGRHVRARGEINIM